MAGAGRGLGRWRGPHSKIASPWTHIPPTPYSNTLAAGGVAVASVYAAVGVGYKDENMDMCDALEEAVAGLVCLWIIGGDWNMPPSQLRQFAQRTGGVVVAPDGPTCTAGARGVVSKRERERDYILLLTRRVTLSRLYMKQL